MQASPLLRVARSLGVEDAFEGLEVEPTAANPPQPGPKPYASAGSVKRSTRAQGDGVSAPLMIPDLDIYRSAKTLIKQHGEDPPRRIGNL